MLERCVVVCKNTHIYGYIDKSMLLQCIDVVCMIQKHNLISDFVRFKVCRTKDPFQDN